MSEVHEKEPRVSAPQPEPVVPFLWANIAWSIAAAVTVVFALSSAPPWVGPVLLTVALAGFSAWAGGMFRRVGEKQDGNPKAQRLLRILSAVLLAVCLAAAVMGFSRHPGG